MSQTYQKVARRAIVDRLVEATSDLTFSETKQYLDTHYERIGSGDEADVYALNEDIVVKISNRENLRGEYVIFADPQYDLVTPEVYGHHPDWYWIAVEKVDPLPASQPPSDFIDGFEEAFGEWTPLALLRASSSRRVLIE